jgi:hypothetical protein
VTASQYSHLASNLQSISRYQKDYECFKKIQLNKLFLMIFQIFISFIMRPILLSPLMLITTRPAWAGFKTDEEEGVKIM